MEFFPMASSDGETGEVLDDVVTEGASELEMGTRPDSSACNVGDFNFLDDFEESEEGLWNPEKNCQP